MHSVTTDLDRPKRLLRHLAACALMIISASSCKAQTDTFSLSSWSTRDGLPESQVQALAHDGTDKLWVGTAGGVCIFDGKQCSVPPYLSQSQFPTANITVTYVAKDGTLWLGTEGSGLIHLSGSKVEQFDRNSGLADTYIRAVIQDATGRLWVGTDGGLFTLKNRSFQRPPELALATGDVHALLEDKQGRIIVGATNSVSIEHGHAEQLHLPGTSDHLQVKSLTTGRGKTVFLGTTEGVFEEDSGIYKRLPLPSHDTESLCLGPDGSLWAGTISNGLWRWKDGKALQISFGVGSAHQSVYAIKSDGQGNLWLGTEDGLRRIKEAEVTVINSSALAVDRETLAIGRNGHVLLANSNLFDITSGTPRTVQLPLSPGTHILNAVSSRNGDLWVGTAGEGITRITPAGKTIAYSSRTKPRIAADYPRGIVEDRMGGIWIASGFGLSRIQGRSVENFDSSNGLPNHNVRALYLTSDGCLWLGTDGGPAIFCHDAFVHNQATQELQGEQIWSIAQSSNGVVWLGTTNHGLFAYTGAGLRHVTVEDGLLTNSICSLVVDDNGSLWIAGPDNLSVVSEEDIQSYLATPKGAFLFTKNLSLPGGGEDLRFTSGRFPSALFDGQNHVWFSSDIGALRVSTKAHSDISSSAMPTPYLSMLQANDTSLQIFPEIRLPARTLRVALRFGVHTLSPENDQLLAYRVKGVDDHWRVASEQHDVVYNSFSPGTYTLELKATSRANHQIWQSVSYQLIIPSVWYRSRWFLVLFSVGLPSLIILAYLFHLRTIRYRFHLVLQERSRLAREMHDTLIQGCNGVTMLLEAESSGRGDFADNDLLDLARKQLQLTVADAREAVWDLRNSEMAPKTLTSRLNAIALQTSDSLDIPVHFRCANRLPELSSKSAHEILMITREAIINAGRHASPSEIQLSIQSTSMHLVVTISDDGCGFDLRKPHFDQSHEHFGLLGMKERALSIESELTIKSTEGLGTTVTLSVPLTKSVE